MNVVESWTVEDREHLAVVTLGPFELPDRGELVRRITENYVPARHYREAVASLAAAEDALARAANWITDPARHAQISAARDKALADLDNLGGSRP